MVWGGLLWLVLVWLARLGGSGPQGQQPPAGSSDGRTGTAATAPPTSPATGTSTSSPAAGRRFDGGYRDRVDDAFVDGLVIGHFLTRDHYRSRIGELEDAVEELGWQRDVWAGGYFDGDDDLDDDLHDGVGFDAVGGLAADVVDDDPWADELFDVDDDLFGMDDED